MVKKKGSTACTSLPAHLLRLQLFHQCHLGYIIHLDFVSGIDNDIFGLPSRSTRLYDNKLLSHLNKTYPQMRPWCIWTPSSGSISTIFSVLRQRKFPSKSLQYIPPPPMATGQYGPSFVGQCPMSPYLSLNNTLYPSSMPSPNSTVPSKSPQAVAQFALGRWRMSNGQLDRSLRQWEAKKPTSHYRTR